MRGGPHCFVGHDEPTIGGESGWLLSVVELYPSQTKILEGGTKDEMMIFEALFKGVSTLFGT